MDPFMNPTILVCQKETLSLYQDKLRFQTNIFGEY